jgi:hypothetical protein
VRCWLLALMVASAALLGLTPQSRAQAADPVLEQVRRQVAQLADQPLALTIRTTAVEDGETVRTTQTYDPSRPVGQRWRFIDRNGGPPTADDLSNYDQRMAKRTPATGFEELEKALRGRAARVAAGDGFVTYRIDRLPAGAIVNDGMDVSRWITLELRVSTDGDPFIERAVFASPRPFSPRFGATIDQARVEYEYRRTASGQIAPVRQQVITRGSALVVRINTNRTREFDNVVARK